jgi:hypothetical protein
VKVPCDQCHGQRFNPETLAVTWRGKNIGDVLNMEIDEAVDWVTRGFDRVLVHGTPDHIAFGERISFATTATVYRAGPIERFWTQWSALFELTELYHCGFEPKEVA